MTRRAAAAVCALALALAGCAAGERPLQFLGGADLVYPPRAKAAGVEGRVLVRYDVDAEGRVRNAVVETAEPAGVFEAAALAAVRSWRFKPRYAGGAPAPTPARVSEVRFRLGADAKYARLPQPRRGDAK